MRNRWIAVGLVALAIGLGVRYRVGKVSRITPASPAAGGEAGAANDPAPPVEPVVEAPAEKPNAKAVDDPPVPRQSNSTWGSTAVAEPVAPPVTAPIAAPAATGLKSTPPAPVPTSMTPQIRAQAPIKKETTSAPEIDPESDRIPPVFQSLRFDPPEIQDGGAAVLSIVATDNLAGVRSITGVIRGPSDSMFVPFGMQDADGSGTFTFKATIPKQAETGDWYVATLQLVDKASNPTSVTFARSTVPPGGVLRVVSSNPDSTAPTVRSVVVEKGTVSGGEKNQVIVEAEDDSSGVKSVNGVFQSPSRAAFLPFTCLTNGDGPWTGALTVPAAAECGEWTLRHIEVRDKAGNHAAILADSPQLGHVGFNVSGGGDCDPDPPVLDTVFVSPTVVSNAAASEVILTITAHDDGSGLSSVAGRVVGPVSASGQAPRVFFATRPDPKNPDAPMTVRLTIPQFAANGIWRVEFLELTDAARNTHAYTAADPALVNAYVRVE